MVALYNYILLAMLLCYWTVSITNNKAKYKRIYIFVFAAILIFFTACRYEYGYSDYRAYINSFYRVSERTLQDIFNNREVGYQLLQKSISLFSDNPQIFFMIAGATIIVAHCFFFKRYSHNIILSLVLFYCLGIYFSAHNATRQYLAIAICLFAYHYAIQGKKWRFLFIVLLASTFHMSALVVVILYPLCNIRIVPKILLIYLGALPIVYLGYPFVIELIQRFAYSGYTGDTYGMVASSRLHLIIPGISVVLIILLTQLRQSHAIHLSASHEPQVNKYVDIYQRAENVCFHMVLLDCVLTVIQVFYALNFGRISWYFGVGICIFYPSLIAHFSRNQRKILTAIVLVAASAYFLVLNNFGKLTPTPYDFFWNH